MRCAFRLAAASAGKSIAARIAMTAMMTNNAVKVKPRADLSAVDFMVKL
jgi:hypothetical protein